MEVKQISETTLKITISLEDLEERGMELHDFIRPQEKTEEFFYAVMDEIDLPSNFRESGMLSFRVTPKRDRVDIFVTKSDMTEELDFDKMAKYENLHHLSPDEFLKQLEEDFMSKGDTRSNMILEEFEKVVEELSAKKAQAKPAKEEEPEPEPQEYVHYVLEFKDLTEVITFAKTVDFPVEASELYKQGTSYYMTVLLYLLDRPTYYADIMQSRMMEHASYAGKTRAYLQEHGRVLMEDKALENLRKIELPA